MTSLADLMSLLLLKHFGAIAIVALVFAGLMEFALKDYGQMSGFALNAAVLTVNLCVLCFLAYAGWNTLIVQRYGSGDLFLSGFLVFGAFMASVIFHKSVAEPESFHPVSLLLGALVVLVLSGIFAIFLPIVGKFAAWMR